MVPHGTVVGKFALGHRDEALRSADGILMKHLNERAQAATEIDRTDLDEMSLREQMLRDPTVPTAYRLNYVANRFTASLYGELAQRFGLDRARFVVMLCLSRVGEATAQDIADATHRPKNSLSRAIRQLEKDGLVERDVDPHDGRRQPMRLTPDGRRMLAEALPVAQGYERRMLDPLEAHEAALLDALLSKIAT